MMNPGHWDIETTHQFDDWFEELPEAEQLAVDATIEALQQRGPLLRRPLVGEVKGSRNHNMKELIVPGGNLRVLFLFDPRRTAILLLGGDKTGLWNQWYAINVPAADDLYDVYLQELRDEGLLPE